MATTQQVTGISQMEFRETAYSDASWEIVGAEPTEPIFIPMELEIIRKPGMTDDPMFADYGGKFGTTDTVRRHVSAQEEEERQRSKTVAEVHEQTERVDVAEMERQVAEAYARGRAEVESELAAQQQASLDQMRGRIESIIADLKAITSSAITRNEVAAVELALAVGKKIVGHAVEINPEYITQLVREGLSLAGGSVVKRVKISPQDLEFIKLVGLETTLKKEGEEWHFEGDARISSGCVIESAAGEINFELDRAWERIADNVMKAVR